MRVTTFFELCLIFILVSCVSGNAPVMERKVKIWNGAPEEAGICRISTQELANKLNTVSYLLKPFHKGTKSIECLSASDDRFKQYASLTFDDLGVIYKLIETMQLKCEKWKE